MSLKNRVLLLNFSYEPINTITIEEAFINWFNGKIYVEEYQDTVYHSAKEEHKVPSVVRLKHYIPLKKKRRDTATKRKRIYIRDKHRCGYCGKVGNDKELTLDHIIPKCMKGQGYTEEEIESPNNLVTCCFACNQIKKNHMLKDCGMTLRYTPKQLQVGLDKVVVNHWGDLRPTWKKYLWLDEGTGDERYSHNE